MKEKNKGVSIDSISNKEKRKNFPHLTTETIMAQCWNA